MYIVFVDNNIFKSATFKLHFIDDRILLLQLEEKLFEPLN